MVMVILDKAVRLFRKCWNDPVGSKLIAGFIPLCGYSLYTGLCSWYLKMGFKEALMKLIGVFGYCTWVNILIWILIFVCIFYLLFWLILWLKKEKICEVAPKCSTELFGDRIVATFPGHRDIKWFDGVEAVKRLKIFFEKQYYFQKNAKGLVCDPFWWMRGHQAMHIYRFRVLSPTKILINQDEYEIKRIAVFVSSSHYRDYIYIETMAERSSGVIEITPEEINNDKQKFGFAYEEYGITKGKRLITRGEYDDGGSYVDGKIVKNAKAELRTRYLTDYNFLLCAKFSPYNCQEFIVDTPVLFNGILQGTVRPEELFEHLRTYKRNLKDMQYRE